MAQAAVALKAFEDFPSAGTDPAVPSADGDFTLAKLLRSYSDRQDWDALYVVDALKKMEQKAVALDEPMAWPTYMTELDVIRHVTRVAQQEYIVLEEYAPHLGAYNGEDVQEANIEEMLQRTRFCHTQLKKYIRRECLFEEKDDRETRLSFERNIQALKAMREEGFTSVAVSNRRLADLERHYECALQEETRPEKFRSELVAEMRAVATELLAPVKKAGAAIVAAFKSARAKICWPCPTAFKQVLGLSAIALVLCGTAGTKPSSSTLKSTLPASPSAPLNKGQTSSPTSDVKTFNDADAQIQKLLSQGSLNRYRQDKRGHGVASAGKEAMFRETKKGNAQTALAIGTLLAQAADQSGLNTKTVEHIRRDVRDLNKRVHGLT